MKTEHTVFLDGVDVSTLGLIFSRGHNNPIISGTRDKSSTIDGTNGEYDFGADLEPIYFSLPFYIWKSDPFTLQGHVRTIKKILLDGFGKPRTFKLQFGYEMDKYYNVRVIGNVDINRIFAKAGEFTLSLKCFEGCAYSVAKNDEVTWGSEVITFTADYSFGHNGSGARTFTEPGMTVVTVTGNNLRPVLHVIGSGTDVTLSCDDKTMTLGTFENANWKLDLENYIVTKDNALALHLIGGSWLNLYLKHGENKILMDGSDLNLTFSVEFRDRFY